MGFDIGKIFSGQKEYDTRVSAARKSTPRPLGRTRREELKTWFSPQQATDTTSPKRLMVDQGSFANRKAMFGMDDPGISSFLNKGLKLAGGGKATRLPPKQSGSKNLDII
ncbi:MAG: hypothetical protein HOA17_00735 [Candidatus Melainabacteria bacterium]|jgi:hypothetical protein|nr:hypothetical protein [Candidatus Melainabacteria bacterium]